MMLYLSMVLVAGTCDSHVTSIDCTLWVCSVGVGCRSEGGVLHPNLNRVSVLPGTGLGAASDFICSG